LILIKKCIIVPQIFINPDHNSSDLELGTKNYPFRSIDDSFRELFNRETLYDLDGSQFSVVINLMAALDP